MAKREEIENFGRVVIYGTPHIEKDYDNDVITSSSYQSASICEILNVTEVFKDRIVTDKYVLPLKDAVIHTSSEGTVYSYNCTLPYLQEVAHLAEVEQNIIISQAFAYQGRTQLNKHSVPILLYVVIGFMGLLALIGMFK